jgi:hypothetical protein
MDQAGRAENRLFQAALSMSDIFLDGLPVLDGLEITGSTSVTARWLRCDQSSVSRTYRRVSALLDLEFGKHNGRYQAGRNRELLRCLRQAAQLRRLEQGSRQLHWISQPDLHLPSRLLEPLGPLPCSWPQGQDCLALLQQRVLDLLVLSGGPAQTLNRVAARRGFACASWSLAPDLTLLTAFELRDHPTVTGLVRKLGSSASLDDGRPVGRALA